MFWSLILFSFLGTVSPDLPLFKVLVPLPPYAHLVKEIGGEEVAVTTLVPPGASGHTYEPTPKEMVEAAQAVIWFRIGEPFEEKVFPVLKSYRPELIVVDLRKGVELIHDPHSCSHCKGEGSEDLHFWLSPRALEIQAEAITQVLETYRANPEFRKRLTSFIEKIRSTKERVESILKEVSQRTILVSHPAYSYYCRDFGLKQLSIEVEGKDPTPRQIVTLVKEARRLQINKIFTQPQYSTKGADLIAADLGAKVVSLDPYRADVLSTLVEVAESIRDRPSP